jgi:hypothetical protein
MSKITPSYSAYASLFASAFLVVAQVFAEEMSPVGLIDYQCKGSKVTPDDELAATQSVKVALMEKYFSSLEPARKTALDNKKATILASVDSYLDNFIVRDRSPFDKKTKTFSLSAQADINTAKINKLIDGDVASGEHQQIVFFFVARRVAEVESKGPKVITATRTIDSNESQAAAGSHSGTVSAGTTTTAGSATESASAVIRKADSVVYAVENNFTTDIARTMSGVLGDRGFEVVPAAALVETSGGKFNPDELQKDFETRSEFTSPHQAVAARTCREAGAPMLAYGTLTIGMKRIDPVNNQNTLTTVKIDAQILDCRKPLASSKGSIGGIQVEGVGADASEAEAAGIKLAAEKAANILADQLHNHGIR